MGRPGRALLFLAAAACASSCTHSDGDVSLSRRSGRVLRLHERAPDRGETQVVAPITSRIERGSLEFARLVRCSGAEILFKDEEGTGADRMMTPRLRTRLEHLARMVQKEWPDVRLRVTEAWDERGEHGDKSLHYEGRAADITTSDADPEKLGRLGGLACDAGLQTVICKARATATSLFKNSVLGIVALVIATLNLMRPSIVLLTGGVIVAGLGIVLYNIVLSGIAIALLILGFARPAPATA